MIFSKFKSSLVFVCMLSIPCFAFGQDQERARQEIAKRKIPLNINAFAERAALGDALSSNCSWPPAWIPTREIATGEHRSCSQP